MRSLNYVNKSYILFARKFIVDDNEIRFRILAFLKKQHFSGKMMYFIDVEEVIRGSNLEDVDKNQVLANILYLYDKDLVNGTRQLGVPHPTSIYINKNGIDKYDEMEKKEEPSNSQKISDTKIIAGGDVNINVGTDNKISSKNHRPENKSHSKAKIIMLIIGTITGLIIAGYVVYDHLYPKVTNTYQPPDAIKNQNDFSINNRAYLAVAKIEEYEKNKVWFIFGNFGKVPNTSGIMRIAVGANITKNDLYDSSKPVLPSGVVLPAQEISQKLLTLPESYMINAKSGKPLEIGILIQYDYAENQKGEYGVIAMYDNASATFDNEDTWVK